MGDKPKLSIHNNAVNARGERGMEANTRTRQYSASEVNRFCYCPMQWYYTRVHGAAALRQMKKELNAEMGWDTSGETAFDKGRDFHRRYTGRYARRLFLRRLLITAVFCALMAGMVWILRGYWPFP
jgi:hypothetical protein